ncbi:hypothetical protein SAMN04488503_2407 [Humidesulfovibrio mexicanus]|jgi:hypothetical protein|uniref:Uncharacterized protein n=1 Tax=Humidesulfovibrio mexicanus TaxID=147047 RepID=A0A239B5G2_9BACT|nr:hypothetical protein [Humidesulfovibrio mexicanus]SNS02454.1 hypothetical protein SAMN04488503_2407 [Humidesulfovibrio mexicanus]
MKNAYRKKLDRAATLIREVFTDLESDESADFDAYGSRLDDLAGELEDLLLEDEDKAEDDMRGGDDDE